MLAVTISSVVALEVVPAPVVLLGVLLGVLPVVLVVLVEPPSV